MSDFIAHVIAELDTAKAQQQMNAFTNAKHKIDVDVNLVSKNGNINGYLNQIKSQFGQVGNTAGNNFANALNTTMGKITTANSANTRRSNSAPLRTKNKTYRGAVHRSVLNIISSEKSHTLQNTVPTIIQTSREENSMTTFPPKGICIFDSAAARITKVTATLRRLELD